MGGGRMKSLPKGSRGLPRLVMLIGGAVGRGRSGVPEGFSGEPVPQQCFERLPAGLFQPMLRSGVAGDLREDRGGREEVVLDEMHPGPEAAALGLATSGAMDHAADLGHPQGGQQLLDEAGPLLDLPLVTERAPG